jgi:hypothetical protein
VHQFPGRDDPELTRWSGWRELAVLFGLSAIIAVIIIITSAPANVHPGTTHTAVLIRGESTSLACSEGVAKIGHVSWVNDNEQLDHLHLPIRGKVHIVNGATAVFTAHHLRVDLAPAMPCTAG